MNNFTLVQYHKAALNKSEINHRNPKFFFGPLLGIFLAAVLAKATAKPRGSGTLHLSYEPHTWHNNPLYNFHREPSVWYPVHPPTPSAAAYSASTPLEHQEFVVQHPEGGIVDVVDVPSGFGEEVAASNVNTRRQKPSEGTVRRRRRTTRLPPSKRNGDSRRKISASNQRRRRPSTEIYYDEDYDYITRPKKKIRTRPSNKVYGNRRRVPSTAYDEYEYEDSFETSTRPYNRFSNRRRPYRGNNRIRDRYTYENYDSDRDYYGDQYEYDSSDEQLSVRQGFPFATESPSTLQTPPLTTQTETTTMETTTVNLTTTPTTTNGYVPGGNVNISFTYGPPPGNGSFYDHYPPFTGYGPSNGNENISFTYGPPTVARYDYVAPFLDWYSQHATKNAVVKRVQDIVNYDTDFYTRPSP